MAQRSIREIDGKNMIFRFWNRFFPSDLHLEYQGVLVEKDSDFNAIESANKWLSGSGLVVKPDMLFGKRGKNGLVYYKKNTPGDVLWRDVEKWVKEKASATTTLLSGQSGVLSHFIVEPFNAHDAEYYLSINLGDHCDELHFSLQGGINIEENWDTVLTIKIDSTLSEDQAHELIGRKLNQFTDSDRFNGFACGAYDFFKEMHYTYLEFNPFVLKDDRVILIDLVAKVDDTAHFLIGHLWGDLEFPAPFGRNLTREESYIKSLDENSGSSLKLTILNEKGKIWTLVAGGGASVVYADTIADMGYGDELATYGEYSGNPTTDETCEYAKTLFDVMTRDPRKGKILIIGGAIANFTDVAKTFTGIINAMDEYAGKLKESDVRIFVRRGGPNYKTGLKNLAETGNRLGLNIHVFGPETHMTDIVRLALEEQEVKL